MKRSAWILLAIAAWVIVPAKVFGQGVQTTQCDYCADSVCPSAHVWIEPNGNDVATLGGAYGCQACNAGGDPDPNCWCGDLIPCYEDDDLDELEQVALLGDIQRLVEIMMDRKEGGMSFELVASRDAFAVTSSCGGLVALIPLPNSKAMSRLQRELAYSAPE